MSEHLDRQQLDRFRQRTMAAEELLQAGDHLNECAECRDRLGESIDWRAPLFGDPERLPDAGGRLSLHLSFEQLAGYIDLTLADVARTRVDSHLRECRACLEELRDLAELASELRDATADPALESWMQRSIPELKQWARGRVPANMDADALVQDVVSRATRHLGHVRPRHPGALQPFLRRALVNRIRDEVRRRIGPSSFADELAAARLFDSVSPMEQMIGASDAADYEQALSRLSAQDRELIVARLEARWSMTDIATCFGMKTQEEAHAAVTRALHKLTEEMRRS
jgi:RNA polymerase sigma factor (sigma-70 family)